MFFYWITDKAAKLQSKSHYGYYDFFYYFLDKLKTDMEEEAFGSDPNNVMVLKTVQTTLFRCMICRKAFRSENGVKKHLEKLHATSEPLEMHYEAFVGLKKVKVPKEPVKEKETSDPSVDSSSIAGLSYKCSMCDNIYHTFQGMKDHLISFHDITCPVTSDLFKYIFAPSINKSMKTSTKPIVKFVTPTIENKRNEKLKDDKKEQIHTSSLIDKHEKKKDMKRKNKEETSKDNKKPKIDFSKTLTNVFTTNNIQMRSLNLWGKSKKEKERETPHLTDTHGAEDIDGSGYQSQDFESRDKPDQALGDSLYCENTEPKSMQSHVISCQSQELFPPTQNNNTESQNSINQSQISLANLTTEQLQQRQKGNKVKVQRKKKLCDDPECRLNGPCSEADCGICRFCENRKLKLVFIEDKTLILYTFFLGISVSVASVPN